MSLRMVGINPYKENVNTSKIQVKPVNAYFKLDSMYGYYHKPGKHLITIDNEYEFTTTHNNLGHRISHIDESKAKYDQSIWVLGCSYTHGWGVNDNQTFTWILQELLPNFQIDNFGISGFGTLQIYLQLQNLLKTRTKPDLIILNHADFHIYRNSKSFARRKNLSEWNFLGDLHMKYARLDNTRQLVIFEEQPLYRTWKLSKKSSLSYLFQHSCHKIYDRLHKKEAQQITQAILSKIAILCKQQNIPIIMTNIEEKTLFLDEFCRDNKIPFIDIGLDMDDPNNNNKPHDGHPSPSAHNQFAKSIYTFLQAEELIHLK